MQLIDLAEQRRLPDSLIRLGIRQLLKVRLRDEFAHDVEQQSQRYQTFLDELRQSPIAIETAAANAQHYEVPADFFRLALGEHLKYSACYWDNATKDLNQAEANMLQLYLQRAELEEGQAILELGCGWGSLTLFMAEHLPNSRITAISNSHSQRDYILQQAAKRNLANIEVITCDVNQLKLTQQFERIVSVEMFEHMRNYEQLLRRVASWLKPQGKLFVHVFCHRFLAYPFATEGDDNWLGRYFFTGGLMPARDTLLYFQKHLHIAKQWDLSGSHYQKTAEAWLQNTDQHQEAIIQLFTASYGEQEALLWLQRWRIFFMSCAELFGYQKGNEWLVAHYLFTKA
ncbi:MAG: cyclopropane-fatty-acyl-phospholipid synthase family protein [Methyloprofundus sp.]|nr:cyclopropane-fatty-acyl-phospholipid synthase family protein [Methyloprofundus sp.]